MPNIKSLSEFNRNQNILIEELNASKKPLYLTRNGSACVVVMDAAAFDEAMEFRNDIFEQEMKTYRGIMRGNQDYVEGRTVDAAEADAAIRKAKGWN